MFEFSIALKYLLPRAKKLSVSLVACLAVGMISLIVWLILVFLSVTEGIEEGWLGRLTKLHGSLSINPTEAYYASYYHKIDAFSGKSAYCYKTLGEKRLATVSDPYSPEEDGELPYRFPEKDCDDLGRLKDPVKELFALLERLEQEKKGLSFQDYEVSGALLRLQILRDTLQGESQGFLTQASYVASFPDTSTQMGSLILPPEVADIQNLLFLASHNVERSREDAPMLSKASSTLQRKHLKSLLEQIKVQSVTAKGPRFVLPLSSFPIGTKLKGAGLIRQGKIVQLDISSGKQPLPQGKLEGVLKIQANGCSFSTEKETFHLDPDTSIGLLGSLELKADLIRNSLSQALSFDDVRLKVAGTIQGYHFITETEGRHVRLNQVGIQSLFDKTEGDVPWVSQVKGTKPRFILPVSETGAYGVVIARSFQEGGVHLGDPGYLGYQTLTTGSLQEQRIPIFVAGFYDPGVLAMGNKLILVPENVAKTLYSATSSTILNPLEATGIHVWLSHYQDAEKIQEKLQAALKKAGLDPYWKVSTFKEYPFTKDLLGQFQSDKILFTLVGVIILLVACGNIISLLILLVSDKKREIGILRALGASSRSIAWIFGGTGMLMGLISSLIGVICALFTMRHIDTLVSILSFFQGRSAFNPSFYGDKLPTEISFHAILFVLIATPMLALLAGLIPAIKACRLKPSEILRSE